jgi:hypothetical protein
MRLDRRSLLLVTAGLVVGAGLTSTGFLLFGGVGDEDSGARGAATSSAPSGTTDTTADITDTEFGELTDAASEDGHRIRWVAQVGGGETVEFVTARRDGTFALIHDDTRVVVAADGAHLCAPECRQATVDEARAALAVEVRPFFGVLRVADEAAASADYRITGESTFSGIVARCGSYDPAAFDLDLPGNVTRVTQCIAHDTGLPITIDLFGVEASEGGASFIGLADARPGDFATS